MSNFIQITPFMHVEDLEKALIFFNDVLGFETQFRARDYAYIHRETAGIRILEQNGADAAPPGTRRFAYYIDVRDVDQLYVELKTKLATLPTRDVYGPPESALRTKRIAGAGAGCEPDRLRTGD